MASRAERVLQFHVTYGRSLERASKRATKALTKFLTSPSLKNAQLFDLAAEQHQLAAYQFECAQRALPEVPAYQMETHAP